MLAYIPSHPSPRPSDHTAASSPTNTMSLAILPSAPMTYCLAPAPALSPNAPSPSKRPKLSLNTSSGAALFGKKSTSLRLETLSATSPTAVNTFSNGYEAERMVQTPSAKSRRPSLTPITTDVSLVTSSPNNSSQTDRSDSPETVSSSATSTTSYSTTDSYQTEIPYKLSYNVTSILSNGPYPKNRYQRHTFAQSRPMFPAPKKVAFRAPLTEDIKTIKYTLAHADIESSASTISTLQLSPMETEETSTNPSTDNGSPKAVNNEAEQSGESSPHTGDKRESSDEEDSETCPATPVAGKRKRHRQWRWTLAPIGSGQQCSEEKNEEDDIKSSPLVDRE
ncbi:Hypothetical protein R9X50_00789600 [Acrodontium crateriforme]|uniref:Uncharacterized protein n=1 Tax=Acrodontium crateriforme TaxID=150365 RepID=A0AAQ3MCE5_9PEZI|nr:Hypothetical protein R9X50_00789600 [Acrodontium crateriforme]